MIDPLVVGVIADMENPAVVARLLGDLEQLAAMDTGISRVEVVVLENPWDAPATRTPRDRLGRGMEVHWIGRAAQERGAAYGRFGRMALPSGRLPIAIARTLVQRLSSERAAGARAAVWILDEDLRLTPSLDAIRAGGPLLSEQARRLRAAGVDVVLGPVLGAPALPARSTARVQLEDVQRHLDLVASLDPDAAWPDRSAENARVRHALPEYYYDLSRAHEDAGAWPMWLERAHIGETVRSAFARLADGVGGLLHGVPITRAIPECPALDAQSAPLARGGNTLVLRPALLARIPNVAPRVGGRVTRRSDMLWVRLVVALEGARVTRAPITAVQDRTGPGRSSFDADKLLDDVRGSALVAALDARIEDGALLGRTPLDAGALARASAIYAARVRERLSTVHRSEERARRLLDEIVSRASPERGGADHLGHPAHATSIERLRGHAAQLFAAYKGGLPPCDPPMERSDVERFFLGLLDEIDAYRSSAPSLRPGRGRQGAFARQTKPG